eukprot:c15364_g1_i2.p1 GENE.c15364_g1_i2~~c15364_g1_i2.p1  ORF type:complete len:422 (+),score=80.53 c15364_g1_i2:123-1388(+)
MRRQASQIHLNLAQSDVKVDPQMLSARLRSLSESLGQPGGAVAIFEFGDDYDGRYSSDSTNSSAPTESVDTEVTTKAPSKAKQFIKIARQTALEWFKTTAIVEVMMKAEWTDLIEVLRAPEMTESLAVRHTDRRGKQRAVVNGIKAKFCSFHKRKHSLERRIVEMFTGHVLILLVLFIFLLTDKAPTGTNLRTVVRVGILVDPVLVLTCGIFHFCFMRSRPSSQWVLVLFHSLMVLMLMISVVMVTISSVLVPVHDFVWDMRGRQDKPFFRWIHHNMGYSYIGWMGFKLVTTFFNFSYFLTTRSNDSNPKSKICKSKMWSFPIRFLWNLAHLDGIIAILIIFMISRKETVGVAKRRMEEEQLCEDETTFTDEQLQKPLNVQLIKETIAGMLGNVRDDARLLQQMRDCAIEAAARCQVHSAA